MHSTVRMHSTVWARTAGRVTRGSATAGRTCSGRGACTCELLRDGEIPARQRAFAHSGGHPEGLLELLGLCGGGRGVTWQVRSAARFGPGSAAPARRELPARSQRAHRAPPRAWREHGARWGGRLRHRRAERELHARAARARLGDLRQVHFEPVPGARLWIRCSEAWAASHTQGGRRRRARGCRRRGAGTAHMAGGTRGAGERAGRGARACARACSRPQGGTRRVRLVREGGTRRVHLVRGGAGRAPALERALVDHDDLSVCHQSHLRARPSGVAM